MVGLGHCESLVKSNDAIIIAALLEGEKPVDWYVREGMPVPKEESWREMIIKVQILTSMLKSSEEYLGGFDHARVHNKLGIVHLFPAGTQKVLCVVTKPENDDGLTRIIRRHLAEMSQTEE